HCGFSGSYQNGEMRRPMTQGPSALAPCTPVKPRYGDHGPSPWELVPRTRQRYWWPSRKGAGAWVLVPVTRRVVVRFRVSLRNSTMYATAPETGCQENGGLAGSGQSATFQVPDGPIGTGALVTGGGGGGAGRCTAGRVGGVAPGKYRHPMSPRR